MSLQAQLDAFNSAEIVTVLHNLAALDYQPSSRARELWMKAWLHAVIRHLRPQLPYFNATDLSLLIVALARFNYTPQWHWCDAYIRASRSKVTKFSPHELAGVFWGLAHLRQPTPGSWMKPAMQQARAKLHLFDAALLTQLGHALKNMSDYSKSGRREHRRLLQKRYSGFRWSQITWRRVRRLRKDAGRLLYSLRSTTQQQGDHTS